MFQFGGLGASLGGVTHPWRRDCLYMLRLGGKQLREFNCSKGCQLQSF